jgi:cytochrome P450 family 142 subfamily A polypeptide 1
MDIDILSIKTWGEGIWDRLRWLRENDPVYWDAKNGLHVISKHEDVAYISKNPQIFCSGQGTRPNMPTRLSIVDMDEPRHGQLRRLINKGFTPRMVSKLEHYFRELTVCAIDDVAEKGECEFVTTVSVPLPLELIAELIGIDKNERVNFHRWSDEMISSDGNYDDPEVMMRATRAFGDYVAYLENVIEERRRSPCDDLVSILVDAKDGGILGTNAHEFAADVLEHLGSQEAVEMAADELKMFLVMLMVAGNETTRNAITGGISALIENPAERQKLIDDPSLIPLAIEEIVRYVSPVLNFARTATKDTELRGKKIKEGEKVLLLYPSANRDADVFDEPDRFIADRDPNPHLAFGIGNHFCLGANLARMEIRVVLEEVLRRIPDLQYADGPPHVHPSLLVRSYVRMPVRFTPEQRLATAAEQGSKA